MHELNAQIASVRRSGDIAQEGNSMKKARVSIQFFLSVIAIAVVTNAQAGIVYFENPPKGDPDHFNWHWQNPFEYGETRTFEHWLDITRPSTDQFGLESPSSVGQLSIGYHSVLDNFTSGGAGVARIEGFFRTRAFQLGELISEEAIFSKVSIHISDDNTSAFDFKEFAYIGVKSESGNFGWIAVERGPPGFPDDHQFTAFGWAYETIPGKPIRAGEIPAPGTLAALAFGAAALIRRRKRI